MEYWRFNWPEKHKLGWGCWVLASCQVSLNSNQKSQRSRKCLGLVFFDHTEKHKLGWGCQILASCQVLLNSFSNCRGEVENVSLIRGQGDNLGFPIIRKNTNLVEDAKYLLPLKFRRILSVVAEGKLKMYRPIRGQNDHLCFLISWKKQNLLEDIVFFASCQVLLNSVHRQPLQRCWKCLDQRLGCHIGFQISPKKHKTW